MLKFKHAGALLPGPSPGSAFYFPAPRDKGRRRENAGFDRNKKTNYNYAVARTN